MTRQSLDDRTKEDLAMVEALLQKRDLVRSVLGKRNVIDTGETASAVMSARCVQALIELLRFHQAEAHHIATVELNASGLGRDERIGLNRAIERHRNAMHAIREKLEVIAEVEFF